MSFLLALALLAASGGIAPPALLPEGLRRLGAHLPIAWMRALAAGPLGYEAMERPAAALLAASRLLCVPAAWLYVRRAGRREAEQ